MNSSERWEARSDQELSIGELINQIRCSFGEWEFSEVQKILMEREKKLKMGMGKVVRDLDSLLERAGLLERSQGLAEFEKLKVEEELQRTKEAITKMREEQRNRAEEVNENNKMMFKLGQEIEDLRREKSEEGLKRQSLEEELQRTKEAITKMSEEQRDRAEEVNEKNKIIFELGQEIEHLRREKSKQAEVVEYLKRQNVEAAQTVEELRQRHMESERKWEASLANLLNAKDVNTIDKPPLAADVVSPANSNAAGGVVSKSACLSFAAATQVIDDERNSTGASSGQRCAKRIKCVLITDDDTLYNQKSEITSDSPNPVHLNDDDDYSEDESCSDAHMEALVESFLSKTH